MIVLLIDDDGSGGWVWGVVVGVVGVGAEHHHGEDASGDVAPMFSTLFLLPVLQRVRSELSGGFSILDLCGLALFLNLRSVVLSHCQ